MTVVADRRTAKYRVEVSGWDESRSFFVENSDLDWSEELGKRVTLNHPLANGTVIFLRLLQPISHNRPHPVAYEAELIAHTERGQRQFRLRPIGSSSRRHMDLFR